MREQRQRIVVAGMEKLRDEIRSERMELGQKINALIQNTQCREQCAAAEPIHIQE